MGKGKGNNIKDQIPIWLAMYLQGKAKYQTFSICLGWNGGFMQLGGYNLDQNAEKINWYKDI